MTRRRLWIGVGTALTVFAVFTGVGVSQALWSDSGTVGGTVKVQSATAGLTVTGLQGLRLEFSGQSSVVSTITLQNSGQTALGNFSVAITPGANDDPNLDTNISVTVWKQTAGACGTPPGTAKTGTWSAWPSDPFPEYDSPNTLAAGASATYCVVSSWGGTTPAVTSDAGKSISPTVTVTAQTGSTTAIQTLSLVAYAPVGVGTSQIGVTATSDNGTPVAVSSVGMYQSSGDSSSELDPVTGTIVNTTSICTTITVSGNSPTVPLTWQLTIDTSKPPYYGATLDSSSFSYPNSSTPSAQIISHAAGTTIYVIGGVGDATKAWGFNAAPVYYNPSYPSAPVINNTPVTSNQQAKAQFCLAQGTTLFPVQAPGTDTYTVGTTQLVDCDNTSNPAPVPVAGQKGSKDLCVLTTITGGYQHFYVGYTFNVPLGSLLAASGYTACEKQWVQTRDPGTWSLKSSAAAHTEVDPTSNTTNLPYFVKSGTGSSTSYQVTSNGTQAPAGISNGQTVTSLMHYYSVPYLTSC
jgi:hypothetical protein